MSDTILLFFIGFISGVFTGFFGVGGGFFLTPALNILGLQIVYAIGTSFFSLVGKAIWGALQHFKQGNVILKMGTLIGLFSIGGVELGKRFVLYLESLNLAGISIRIAYIVILVLISLFMLRECATQRKRTAQKLTGGEIEEMGKNNLVIRRISRLGLPPKIVLPYSEHEFISIWVLVVAGLLIGISSGILGVGGGFISLPFLIYILGIPAIMAVGTSLIIVIFTSSYGALTYAITGHVDWTTAFIILIGSFLGIQLGVLATKIAAEIRIKVLFSILLLCIAVSVLLKQVNQTDASSYLVVSGSLLLCLIIFWPIGRDFIVKTALGKKGNTNEEKI
jgi:uncharacterized membrane protein YfcA